MLRLTEGLQTKPCRQDAASGLWDFQQEFQTGMRQRRAKTDKLEMDMHMSAAMTTTRLLLAGLMLSAGASAFAGDSDQDEYAPELPDMAIYKAMLDANKQPGWIQFRNYDDRQLIYFTTLQTMRCRLSEVRYSIDSDALDQRFPLGGCDPQQPFNIPADDPENKYIYLDMKEHKAKTLTIQVVWADGSGSEIVTYRPCDNVGDSTCARIKKIAKPKTKLSAPTPSSQSR
jgi:hypothetical protein